jgi:outer membrane immunogenic protein
MIAYPAMAAENSRRLAASTRVTHNPRWFGRVTSVNSTAAQADGEASMKRRLLASVGFAALVATSALAADVPPLRSMPPPRAPAFVPFFSWNGFYVGLNAGYGFGSSNWSNNVTAATTGDFDISGVLVGGTIGYNLQFGSAVFGIEADIDWTNIKGSIATNCIGTCETSSDWLGTVRGRIGYAFDRFLPYATAGAAFGDIKGSVASGARSFSETNVGWTAGAGLEYAFISSWSAKVEYLYVDLGKATCDATCSGTNPFDVTFTTHIVRAGLNYKF